MSLGAEGYFGIARETTFGSYTAATRFVEILNESVTLDISRFDYKNVYATLAKQDDTTGVYNYGGQVVFAAHPEVMIPFLNSLFWNSRSVTSLSANLWRHTYLQPFTSNSMQSANCPSIPYSVEVYRGDATFAHGYSGCVFNRLGLSFAINQEVRVTAGMMAKFDNFLQTKQTSITYPSSPTEPFKFNTATVSIQGMTDGIIESLNIDFSNAFEAISTLGGGINISKFKPTGPQEILITGTYEFDDVSKAHSFYYSQAEKTIDVKVTASNSFELHLHFPRCKFTSHPLQISGSERVLVDFEAAAFVNTASKTACVVNLTTTSSGF